MKKNKIELYCENKIMNFKDKPIDLEKISKWCKNPAELVSHKFLRIHKNFGILIKNFTEEKRTGFGCDCCLPLTFWAVNNNMKNFIKGINSINKTVIEECKSQGLSKIPNKEKLVLNGLNNFAYNTHIETISYFANQYHLINHLNKTQHFDNKSSAELSKDCLEIIKKLTSINLAETNKTNSINIYNNLLCHIAEQHDQPSLAKKINNNLIDFSK